MNPRTHPFISVLVRFLLRHIEEKQVEYLVPLESKGALLLDLALEYITAGTPVPKVLYLRSLEYLEPEVRRTATFAVIDDFLFSGRTLQRAVDNMEDLGIDRAHIHTMAFFSFVRPQENGGHLSEIIAATAVPHNKLLSQLSRNEILKEVQQLAIAHKIPASYDNLSWDIFMDRSHYERFMRDLEKTGWYLYYGRRGSVDASALLVREVSRKGYAALPKIRFWYDKGKECLHLCPISFSSSARKEPPLGEAELAAILTPDNPLPRQRTFAVYLAHAFTSQLSLLGYLKPYLRKQGLATQLNQHHLERYFGPRAPDVIRYLVQTYPCIPDLPIPSASSFRPRPLDFYWIAVEMMRELGRMYWTQRRPNKISKGLSVAEIIQRFGTVASEEAIHAAVDYCADKNLIATFFRWTGDSPTRAFRLTENGEREVGRNDGINPVPPTFIEKVAALIMSKSSNHEVYWWVLEKIPAILARRLQYEFPEFEAAIDHFGDTLRLHPSSESDFFVTWPNMKTEMWKMREERGRTVASPLRIFKLSDERYNAFQNDILSDPRIVQMIGPIETLIEMTRSRTMGHHVAILLDILSDRVGGTTYIANSLNRASDRIDEYRHLSDDTKRRRVSRDVGMWLKGADEKCEILGPGCSKLLEHINGTVNRLKRQGRGDIASQLMRSQPFSTGNRIIPAFRDLIMIVARINQAAWDGRCTEFHAIARLLARPALLANCKTDDDAFISMRRAITRWVAALSAEEQDTETYLESRLETAKVASQRLYIVAYDIIGSSTPRYDGKEGADLDRRIQSIITNWIIAFGGHTQHADFGRGDLGFGFFPSAPVAIQACLWAAYHLNLLKETDPILRQDQPHAGFAIVEDSVAGGFMGQARATWLSRFAKAWKHEAERIADSAGRAGRPTVAVHNEIFAGLEEIPAQWLGAVGELDGIPVRFIKEEALQRLPWQPSA